jgi:predicted DNA-binding helix-hairpin-helix protein
MRRVPCILSWQDKVLIPLARASWLSYNNHERPITWGEMPEFEKKLELLGGGARFDLSCACGAPTGRVRSDLDRWIYPSVLPGGRSAHLLKVLLTNACERNCRYCENRAGRDSGRAAFGPGELAEKFMDMHRAGLVMGLFLSSALAGGGVRTMDRMIATAEILRRRHGYRGYLHLKILPGAQEAQVERAGMLATRVSINLEVPSRRFLPAVAPDKLPDEIAAPLSYIRKYRERGLRSWAPSGYTTQFMVGAAGETDRDILATTQALYGGVKASRVYYSAFQPVEGTPLEHAAACPLWREHRLYQSEFLIRKYGFHADELVFDDDGNLDESVDPKTAWAGRHPESFPLEVNDAPPELLLRVPGIGPESARRIAAMRLKGRIRSLDQVRAAGALAGRAAPYLLLDGRAAARPQQLELFAPDSVP